MYSSASSCTSHALLLVFETDSTTLVIFVRMVFTTVVYLLSSLPYTKLLYRSCFINISQYNLGFNSCRSLAIAILQYCKNRNGILVHVHRQGGALPAPCNLKMNTSCIAQTKHRKIVVRAFSARIKQRYIQTTLRRQYHNIFCLRLRQAENCPSGKLLQSPMSWHFGK